MQGFPQVLRAREGRGGGRGGRGGGGGGVLQILMEVGLSQYMGQHGGLKRCS